MREIRRDYGRLGFAPSRRGPVFFDGQWLKYSERRADRERYAQPDLYLHLGNKVLCFEFKLTRCREGLEQIRRLYAPLLDRLYGVPIIGVSTFYNPGPSYEDHSLSPTTLEDCLDLPEYSLVEWHYLA